MNTQKASSLKTFLQYLGRGAAMFDGGYSTEAQHAPGADSAEKNDAYGGGSRIEDGAVPAAPVQHAGPRVTGL